MTGHRGEGGIRAAQNVTFEIEEIEVFSFDATNISCLPKMPVHMDVRPVDILECESLRY
jgi:hypothetical protein